jgi:hypothetical protein
LPFPAQISHGSQHPSGHTRPTGLSGANRQAAHDEHTGAEGRASIGPGTGSAGADPGGPHSPGGQGPAGDELTVYGNGTQSRCFAHVLDVVDFVVRVIIRFINRRLVIVTLVRHRSRWSSLNSGDEILE